MCGIVGVFDRQKETTESVVHAMLSELSHRGPDDAGEYSEPEHGLFLAQRRLSLIDLSPSGHQPMVIGDLVIVFNGEIYNYQEIKLALKEEGVICEGDSDTEVLLRAWQLWREDAIKKLRGMFVFAIWDRKTRQIHLYRDRVGVKPLYYYCKNGLFIFASELKAIIAHPAVERVMNADAVSLYLQLGYVPAPYSILDDIHKLEPGTKLLVDDRGQVLKNTYWSIADSYQTTDQERTEAEVLAELENKLTDAFKLRMIADVPVGVFLSGGIDSSLVTAILKKNGFDNLSTYTIGFSESTHDESLYGRAVAEYLQTDHHELRCTAKEAQAIVPLLTRIYDEPFADVSSIPTYLVAQFAKSGVTAALSADGGDELFGGYTRYTSAQTIFNVFSLLPPGLSPLIRSALYISRKLTDLGILRTNWSHKLNKAYLFYQNRHDLMAIYAVLTSYFTDAEVDSLLRVSGSVRTSHIYAKSKSDKQFSSQRQLQHTDFHSYLPDDVLVKVDRASMAVSLEGREPFLDHTVIEFSAGIPDELMHKEKTNKYLLRQLLYRYVPKEMVDRPKQGFGVPMSQWLKHDLRYLIDEYLSESAIESTGLLQPEVVAKEKVDFLSGRQPYNRVWSLIILQMWYKEYLK